MKTKRQQNLLVHPPQWLCYGGRAAALVGTLWSRVADDPDLLRARRSWRVCERRAED